MDSQGATLDLTGLTNAIGWEKLCSAHTEGVSLKIGALSDGSSDATLRRVLYNPPAIR